MLFEKRSILKNDAAINTNRLPVVIVLQLIDRRIYFPRFTQ